MTATPTSVKDVQRLNEHMATLAELLSSYSLLNPTVYVDERGQLMHQLQEEKIKPIACYIKKVVVRGCSAEIVDDLTKAISRITEVRDMISKWSDDTNNPMEIIPGKIDAITDDLTHIDLRIYVDKKAVDAISESLSKLCISGDSVGDGAANIHCKSLYQRLVNSYKRIQAENSAELRCISNQGGDAPDYIFDETNYKIHRELRKRIDMLEQCMRALESNPPESKRLLNLLKAPIIVSNETIDVYEKVAGDEAKVKKSANYLINVVCRLVMLAIIVIVIMLIIYSIFVPDKVTAEYGIVHSEGFEQPQM